MYGGCVSFGLENEIYFLCDGVIVVRCVWYFDVCFFGGLIIGCIYVDVEVVFVVFGVDGCVCEL